MFHTPSISKVEKQAELMNIPIKKWDTKGEKELDTVKREVEEETGLKDIDFIERFKETIKYFFRWGGKNILKFVTFYLAETDKKEVRISEEHTEFKWLPYEEAIERLSHKNAKEILRKANDFLNSRFT